MSTSLTPMSPFDRLKQTRPDGTDFWSARDLMPLLGYERWERFAGTIDRAKVSVENQGVSVEDHFRGAAKMVELGDGAMREIRDFFLTRFAVYVIAQNGDPRKPEIAAAQGYFAVKTREAETRPAPTHSLPASYADALRELAATVEAKEHAEALVAELEAPAAAWEGLASGFGDYTVTDAAKILARAGVATGQRKLYAYLQRQGWIFHRGKRWQAMQSAVNAGYLVERITGGYFDDETGERKQGTPQVRITPRGIERLLALMSGNVALLKAGGA